MGQVLVRAVDDSAIERLRRRARRKGRSLQAEVKEILERAAAMDVEEALAAAAEIRARLAGQRLADSVDLLREDRDR